MGIVVPAAVPLGKKDSVEVLLEGMTTPQPPRTKTMPQTDGEASASYHARHDVRAARTSPDDEASVIVERSPASLSMPQASSQARTPLELAATVPAPGVDRVDAAQRVARDKRAADARLPTAELPARLGPRIALACAAGMLVVLFLFVALAAIRAGRPAEERAPSATAAPAEPSAAVLTASAAPSSAPVSGGAGAPPANVNVTSAPLSSAASIAPTQVAKAAPRPRDKANTAAAGSPAASSVPDLSELKTSFH
jgi:hypothetical protein